MKSNACKALLYFAFVSLSVTKVHPRDSSCRFQLIFFKTHYDYLENYGPDPSVKVMHRLEFKRNRLGGSLPTVYVESIETL